MKRVQNVNRNTCSNRVVVAALASLCAPLSVYAVNTNNFVIGTDLTLTGSYSGGTPVTSSEVVINSSTPTPGSLTLGKASGAATLGAAAIDILYTGTTVIDNNGATGSTITLFASGAAGSTNASGFRDAIYVPAGSNTFTYSSTTNHSNGLVVGNSSTYEVGTGSTFNYNAAAAGQINLGNKQLTLTGGGNINLGTLTNTSSATLISDLNASSVNQGGSLLIGDNAAGRTATTATGFVTINLGSNSNVSYTGATTIQANSTLTINSAGTSGTLAYNTAGAASVFTNNGTLTLAPFNGRTITFANNVTGSGAVVFQKSATAGSGSAFLNMTGNSTYAGGTKISGGTLRANNTIDSLGTGTTTVNATGTLAGGTKAATGVTGGIVSVNGDFTGTTGGIVTAGTGALATDTVGTLSMTSLNANGGSYAVKLDGANATAGATGSGTAGSLASDLLLLTGLTANGAGSLTINPVFLTAGTSAFTNAAAGTTYSFVIADATGAANAAAFDALINQPANSAIVVSNTSPLGTFALNTVSDGNAGEYLLLDFTTATPEPASLLCAATVLPLAMGRRRRMAAGR